MVMEKPHILIVEDDLDLAEMLNAYFRVQNYDVQTAAWGEEALKLVNETNFDLVVLDIRLPDIDGYELCRRLRLQRRTKDTPIIFLTEKRDRVDKLQGLELGVVDYITKPFDIQELRLRVRNAINRAQRPSMFNPVTDLPEGDVVEDRLAAMLKPNAPQEWGLLQVMIGNLGAFRERYGFVAADDVLRAVTLMVRNAVREQGSEADYVAQLGEHDFIVMTTAEKVESIRERLERRIEQSSDYFYPARDRDPNDAAMTPYRLKVTVRSIKHSDGSFENLAALKDALSREEIPADTPAHTPTPDDGTETTKPVGKSEADSKPAATSKLSSPPPAAGETESTTPPAPGPAASDGKNGALPGDSSSTPPAKGGKSG